MHGEPLSFHKEKQKSRNVVKLTKNNTSKDFSKRLAVTVGECLIYSFFHVWSSATALTLSSWSASNLVSGTTSSRFSGLIFHSFVRFLCFFSIWLLTRWKFQMRAEAKQLVETCKQFVSGSSSLCLAVTSSEKDASRAIPRLLPRKGAFEPHAAGCVFHKRRKGYGMCSL